MGTQADAQAGARPAKSADPATREVLDAIRRIVRALRESSRAAERSVGIGAAQLFVLQRLAASPGLSLNELAARTFTHQSSVSVVVSRLVERGLLTRARGGDDGRRVSIALAPAGRALLARAPAAAQERLLAGLGLLGAGSRRQLADLLGRLVDLMALPDRSPPMFFEAAPAGTRKRKKRRDRLV
ncbi:MAG TPA: MarR family winged helix-turn-helix transcriptional regulator [Polyangia bacterium]|jgi:DNA-binding MarR family transcriptional regulator|nr:MarR family winged helix-turn-helix transcriptional regulator [Polyangia bacterium]